MGYFSRKAIDLQRIDPSYKFNEAMMEQQELRTCLMFGGLILGAMAIVPKTAAYLTKK